MPLKNKYLKYTPEISSEIFKEIWTKLIDSGWKATCDFVPISDRFHEFKNGEMLYNDVEDKKNFYINYKSVQNHIKDSGRILSETTVQEILGYDPFVKEEFILPGNWVCKMTNESKDALNNYRKNIVRYNSEDCGWDYMLPNGSGGNLLDGIEITFDQFKKYVLKENNEVTKEEVIEEVIPEYVDCVADAYGLKKGNIYKVNPIGFILGANEDIYYSTYYVKPSTKKAFDAQNKPKQSLKQAVHCKTQEEYKAVKEFYNSQNYGGHFCKKNDCIPLDNPTQTAYKDYYVNNNYKLLSFQEWCDLNGYKMKKEIKFEIGDWMVLGGNYSHGGYSVGDLIQIESFTGNTFTAKEKNSNKLNTGFSLTLNRHATPEEINNHLISIGQIPAGEPLNTGIEPNKDGMFKCKSTLPGTSWSGGTIQNHLDAIIPTTGNSYSKDFSTSIIPGPLKMILSIDDEELPMVNTIKTKTVNLLNLE